MAPKIPMQHTSSPLRCAKLKEQELESEGKDPTAGQQSQIMKVTPEMNPEHSPDFDL